MEWSEAFLNWTDENDLWFARFSDLADLTEAFLLETVLRDRESAEQVAERLWDVLQRCDEMTYEEPGAVGAYAALHLLDRYHRFQIISRALIEASLLPVVYSRGIDVLDVGTGPGPALYALSDTYSMLRRFGTEQGIPALEKLDCNLDYSERSEVFRSWLHGFTEFVNHHRPRWPCQIPFHHGTFRDFEDVEFNQRRETWDCDDDGDEYRIPYTVKHRFNVISLSNFFTRADQVAALREQLQDCASYLRNRGILLVAGARGLADKYLEVYNRLSETITSGSYSNWRFRAFCTRVGVKPWVLSYSYKDAFGVRLKQLYVFLLSRLEELGVSDHIPPQARSKLEATVGPGYDRKVTWEIHVFRKHARLRLGKSKRR